MLILPVLSLRLAEIVFAASIALLAGYTQVSANSKYVGMAIGVIGPIVAVLTGIMSLYRFQQNWKEYRAGVEPLKQEKYLYLARVEPYNGDQPFELLVQRVEALLKSGQVGHRQCGLPARRTRLNVRAWSSRTHKKRPRRS